MTVIGVRRILFPLVFSALACRAQSPTAPAPTALTSLPRVLSASEQKLIASSNTFGFDLFKQINSAQRDSNVFVSPLSASMALEMTANGAGGTTYDAFHSTLRLGDATKQEVNDGYKSLIALLTSLDPDTDMRIANSIWYEKTFPVKAAFLTESKSYFNAQVRPLYFRSVASVDTVNSWVSDATMKKIPTIIDSIDPAEVMFLINAIYFNGSWQQKFDKANTVDAPFYGIDGKSRSVPLMHLTKDIRVAVLPGMKAVDLYYGNSAFAMTVVLPDSGTSVNALTESMNGTTWQTLLNAFHSRPVEVFLPRFKVEWQKKLNDDLSAMGLGIAFSDNADFTPMSEMGNRLDLSRVIQKTFVNVDEEGTEAAAATVVGVQQDRDNTAVVPTQEKPRRDLSRRGSFACSSQQSAVSSQRSAVSGQRSAVIKPFNVPRCESQRSPASHRRIARSQL
ncbi:MAG: serpin family protein [Gemmatimonadaceae bacterium]